MVVYYPTGNIMSNTIFSKYLASKRVFAKASTLPVGRSRMMEAGLRREHIVTQQHAIGGRRAPVAAGPRVAFPSF